MSEPPSAQNCPTVLLDDLPANFDGFSQKGELGPHERVADAIASLILSDEPGGKAIGLEGGWGSGKSTVVKLVEKALRESGGCEMVTFDAWAHEGDPLRRTYLESLIQPLADSNHIPADDWKLKAEQLAKRHKTTNTKTVRLPTLLGTLVAIALLFVPIGSAFLKSAFDDGLTIDRSLPFSTKAITGISLILAPVVVHLLFGAVLVVAWGLSSTFAQSASLLT